MDGVEFFNNIDKMKTPTENGVQETVDYISLSRCVEFGWKSMQKNAFDYFFSIQYH